MCDLSTFAAPPLEVRQARAHVPRETSIYDDRANCDLAASMRPRGDGFLGHSADR
jgi:hypothetical protein